MVNSLFMLGSSYNRNKKISIIFMVGWILYMIIQQFCLGITFPIINTTVFLIVTISINLIKNKKINTVLSVFSILISSIIIDVICYYFYPLFSSNQNIFDYIWQGILFNYKYIFSNIMAVCAIYGLDVVINKIENFIRLKEKVAI